MLVLCASSMVVLYAARHRVPVPSLARWLLGLGIAATLTANMAQGWSHGPVGAVVAAWPAVSLVGSYELLVWLIRTSGTAEHNPPSGHLGDVAACRAAAPSASTAATAIEFPACIIRFCAKVTPWVKPDPECVPPLTSAARTGP